jgi:hypothetical protein
VKKEYWYLCDWLCATVLNTKGSLTGFPTAHALCVGLCLNMRQANPFRTVDSFFQLLLLQFTFSSVTKASWDGRVLFRVRDGFYSDCVKLRALFLFIVSDSERYCSFVIFGDVLFNTIVLYCWLCALSATFLCLYVLFGTTIRSSCVCVLFGTTMHSFCVRNLFVTNCYVGITSC